MVFHPENLVLQPHLELLYPIMHCKVGGLAVRRGVIATFKITKNQVNLLRCKEGHFQRIVCSPKPDWTSYSSLSTKPARALGHWINKDLLRSTPTASKLDSAFHALFLRHTSLVIMETVSLASVPLYIGQYFEYAVIHWSLYSYRLC